jgi:TPR repeat protein
MRDEWVEGHSEHRAGAFALKIALFAIIAGGVFSFVNRQQAGEWLIRLGDKISGGQAQQSAKAEAVAPYSGAEATPTSSSSAVTPGQNKSTADAPPATRSDMPAGSGTVNSTAVAEPSPAGPDQATAPAARTQRLGDSNSGSETDAKKPTTDTRRNSPASSDENEGEEDFALAQRYLHGTNGPADSAIAAHLLWAAVGHGNTEAELQLANMYLRGEGVPQKNCQQARILLTAAYRNYKPLAGEKLAELREYGCP